VPIRDPGSVMLPTQVHIIAKGNKSTDLVKWPAGIPLLGGKESSPVE
jgi:hypothetical protein